MISPDAHMRDLAALIRRELGAPDAEITRQTTSEDIDGWDSLAHACLILAIEKAFGIRFPGAKLFDLDCVGDLLDLILECLGAAGRKDEAG